MNTLQNRYGVSARGTFPRQLSLVALGLLVVGVSTPGVFGQSVTATLFGTVTDNSGSIVPNAAITVVNEDTGLVTEAHTNETGEYRVPFLQIGHYRVEVAEAGFSKAVKTGIMLEAGRLVKIDASLTLGAINETITVESASPLINTANAEVGTTVENVLVTESPIVNLNPYQLLDFVPGVQSNSNQQALGLPEQHTQMNGSLEAFGSGTVNYFLDGGQNVTSLRNTGNILPAPDSIQEFRVQAINYSADYGRFAGGVINVITKSGSNRMHGSLYEFWRNDRLNARPWRSVAANPPLHRNQFGATLGGPILRDKTFFFGSYAGLRETAATFLNGTNVPTALERNADGNGYDFSASAQKPKDPYNNNQPFTCNGRINVICPNYHIDLVAIALMKAYVPLPNVAGTSIWQGSVITPDASDGFLLKIDHKLSATHQLRGSYFNTSGYQLINSGSSSLPYARTNYSWRQHNINLSDTWTVSPSAVNQVWLSYTRAFGARVGTPNQSLRDFGSTFVVLGPPTLPLVSVQNYFFLGNQISGPTAGNNFYSLRDLLLFTKGKHSFRVGFEEALNKDAQYTNLRNYGSFSFNGLITGNGLADYLVGVPSQVIQETPVTPSNSVFTTSLFAQDDYRVSPRVTLNLGLRWDIQTAPKDTLDRQSAYVPGSTSTVRPGLSAALLFPGDPGVPRGIIGTSYTHLAPRIGFAWDPQGDGRSSIRGGFGMFWGGLSTINWNGSSNSAPFALSLAFPNAGSITGASLADPYRNYPGGNPFPYSSKYIVPGTTLYTNNLGFNYQYSYQMNLSVQRQVTQSLSLTAGYVSTLSYNLPYLIDRNYPVATPTATASAGNILSRRPNATVGSVFDYSSVISGNYNALQISAEKRLAHGISFLANYVWSKTLDGADVQDYLANPQDYNNIAAEKGRANTDLRHVFSTGLVFQANYLHSGNFLVRQVANGWQVSTIVRITSGAPFNLLNGLDSNLDGNATDRPNLVGNFQVDHPTATRWFNTSAFTANPIVTGHPTVGNTSHNLISGPGYERVDLGVQRNFDVSDWAKIGIRVEGTNMLNHPSLTPPGSNVSAPSTLGQIFTAGAMRQLQLGARITF